MGLESIAGGRPRIDRSPTSDGGGIPDAGLHRLDRLDAQEARLKDLGFVPLEKEPGIFVLPDKSFAVRLVLPLGNVSRMGPVQILRPDSLTRFGASGMGFLERSGMWIVGDENDARDRKGRKARGLRAMTGGGEAEFTVVHQLNMPEGLKGYGGDIYTYRDFRVNAISFAWMQDILPQAPYSVDTPLLKEVERELRRFWDLGTDESLSNLLNFDKKAARLLGLTSEEIATPLALASFLARVGSPGVSLQSENEFVLKGEKYTVAIDYGKGRKSTSAFNPNFRRATVRYTVTNEDGATLQFNDFNVFEAASYGYWGGKGKVTEPSPQDDGSFEPFVLKRNLAPDVVAGFFNLTPDFFV